MLALLVRLAPRILLVAPVVTLGSFLASDTADPSGAAIDALLKGGPFAFVLGLILLDKLDTTGERNLLRTQLAESQARERTLYENIKNDLAPALLDNTRMLSDVMKPLLERVARTLESKRE